MVVAVEVMRNGLILYIYVCMCVRVCVYMYVCVYIYMERERKRVEFANGSDMGWKKKNGVKNDSTESFEENGKVNGLEKYSMIARQH